MTTVRLIVEMDLETGKVKVGHPNSKIHCDYMLAEAKRILDRIDDRIAAGERNAGSQVAVPDRTVLSASSLPNRG